MSRLKIFFDVKAQLNPTSGKGGDPTTFINGSIDGQHIQHLLEITLTKELCAQPLRLVWLIVCTKTELEKDIEYRCIKNLSGFMSFTSDYRS